MKLLAKYNRINIITSVLIFVCGYMVFCFVVHFILVHQLDERLETEKAEIVKYVSDYKKLPVIINTDDQQIYVSKTNKGLENIYLTEKTWNEYEHENELMRKLLFAITVEGEQYEIKVQISQEHTEALLKIFLLVAAVMIAVILLAGYIINRIVFKNLWKPFYRSIQEMAGYDLNKQQSLQLPEDKIDEFNLLNKSLNEMTARVASDYQILKEFTGNASHEMQTPLAVISANTESLMQDESTLGLHHESIFSIEDAVRRLSRLNQSLLLLTKIENKRFELNEKVEWDRVIKERLAELQDLISKHKLRLIENITPVSTIFHLHLADIIITNLVSNAIRYNYEGGLIDIFLDNSRLTISNTSELGELDVKKVFNRFYRHPETKVEGNGLGLSIVQQTCKLAGYTLSYSYREQMHFFTVNFNV